MIEVDLPDGSIAEFPDNTDKTVIQAALQKHFSKTAPADPTAGMTAGDKFAAAYGSVLPRLGRGLRQGATEIARATQGLPESVSAIPIAGPALGMIQEGGKLLGVDDAMVAQQRADEDEIKRLEAPLMATRAGNVGNIAGNVAAALPTAFVPGANTYSGSTLLGGLYGLAEPVGSEDSRTLNTIAGGAGGFASQLAGRVLGGGYQALKSYFAPLTKEGQEKIVAATLKRFASDPEALARAATYQSSVSGVQPSLAEATLDPGIATLQLATKNADPAAKALLVRQELNNNAGRLAALQEIAKTPAEREAAVEARESAAQALYGKAFESDAMRRDLAAQALRARAQAATGGIGTPQQLATAERQLSDDLSTPGLRALAERPAFQSAMAQAKSLAADKGMQLGDPLQSLQGLHYIKLALDDMLEGTPTNALSRNAKASVTSMKKQLLDEIKTIAPTYDAARSTFAEMSAPINQMDVGRELYDRLVPALTESADLPTRITAGQYANALRNAEQTAKRATGMNVPLEKIMTGDQMAVLTGIERDLGRKASADDLARTIGSTTAQNLAAQNLMRQTLGPLGVPSGWLEGEALPGIAQALLAPYKLTNADQAINQRLAQALANPQEAAAMVQRLAPADREALARFLSRAALPAGIVSRDALQE